ncbi:hypothetical protein ACFX10_043982 [Malus domestica]
MPAYGGMKSIYTAGPLPVASKDSVVKLAEKDGPGVFVLPMAAQAHLPPPMAQASAPGGPAPAQASSSSATGPPPSSSSKGPFCFFKPTACKPESLMAFFGPKNHLGSQNSIPFPIDEEQTTLYIFKIFPCIFFLPHSYCCKSDSES